MGRRAASHDRAGQIAAAQKPDLTNAIAPTNVVGYGDLNDEGVATYTAFWRCRHEHTAADLALLVQAAAARQRLTQVEAQLDADGLTQTNEKTGVVRAHPLLATADMLRKQIAASLAGANVRTRDGKRSTLNNHVQRDPAPVHELKTVKKGGQAPWT